MTDKIIDLVDRQIRQSEITHHLVEGEEIHTGAHEQTRIITISRELGSGGRRVAEALAEKLHLGVWDKELLDQIANNADVADYLVKRFDERVVSEIEILLRHIVGEPRIGGFQYKRHLTRTILQIARIGNAIILGHGGNFILPNALNVRIIASREMRIHNMIQYEGLNEREASNRIEESDRARADFTRRLWGRDWNDPLIYDLTLRMDEISNVDAADIIAEAFRLRFHSNVQNQ